MMNSVIPDIKKIAQKYSADLSVEESRDASYIDCVLQASDIDVYILATKFEEGYFAYGLESSFLPRELYPDSITRKEFSLADRNDEILRNVELILSKRVAFFPSPSILNKKRGYIVLDVDGIKTRIYQKEKGTISSLYEEELS